MTYRTDTGTGTSCPRGPARGPRRCRCWCKDSDCRRLSPRSVVLRIRCNTGTRTPPFRSSSSTLLAGTIGVLAAIVGFGGHLQAYTLRAPQLGHHWRAEGDAKKGFILIKATRRLRTEDKKKAYNRPNGNHKQGKNGSPKAASSGTSWI